MAEPSAALAGIAITGLTLFGVATGLDPAVLIAGFAGGVWAQSYQPPLAIWWRVLVTALSSILAGYLAPLAAAITLAMLVKFGIPHESFTLAALQLPVAVLIGLTAHRVLGPAFMRLATKKIEEVSR